MKIKVETSEWEKVTSEKELDLPEETLYFWHNSIRRAYSVKPIWTKWNKEHKNKEEEIYEYDIIEIDPNSFGQIIKTITLKVSSFGGILKDSKHPYLRLVENIVLKPEEDRRTKERFMEDYNQVLEKIKGYL